MVQFGQILPVLPPLGNWKAGQNRRQKRTRGIATEAMKAFSGILLGVIAALVLPPIRKENAFINGGVTLPRLVLKPISGLAANDFPRDHWADRDGGGSGR
jgi:hypothetical protein